jgi:hypothetical protein
MRKEKNIRNTKTFDELLDIKYGKIGTKKRDEFEKKAKDFVVKEKRNQIYQKYKDSKTKVKEGNIKFSGNIYNLKKSFD